MSGVEFEIDGHDGHMALCIDPDAITTDQAMDIVSRLAPEFLDLFLRKNRKYRKVGNDLGERGVFPDINRKVGIIRDRIWDDGEEEGEPTREVIMDLIGHLFLMLHMIDDNNAQHVRAASRITIDPAGISIGGSLLSAIPRRRDNRVKHGIETEGEDLDG